MDECIVELAHCRSINRAKRCMPFVRRDAPAVQLHRTWVVLETQCSDGDSCQSGVFPGLLWFAVMSDEAFGLAHVPSYFPQGIRHHVKLHAAPATPFHCRSISTATCNLQPRATTGPAPSARSPTWPNLPEPDPHDEPPCDLNKPADCTPTPKSTPSSCATPRLFTLASSPRKHGSCTETDQQHCTPPAAGR
jgi:hypothetical protein